MSILTKQRVETIKTVVIAVLVSGILAFAAGYFVANQNSQDKVSAVRTAVEQTKSVK